MSVKCVFCKNEIEKGNSYKVGTRQYFCDENCYQKHLNKLKFKPSKQASNPEVASRRKCLDYIQLLYHEQGFADNKINWPLICTQIKKQMDDNKFKWSGIQYVLWYLKEIKEANLFNEDYAGSVVNLVPYYYEEAKDFYNKTQMIAKEINSKDEDFFEDDIIYISPHKERIWSKKYNESIEDL